MKTYLIDNGCGYSDYSVYGFVIVEDDSIDSSVMYEAAKDADREHKRHYKIWRKDTTSNKYPNSMEILKEAMIKRGIKAVVYDINDMEQISIT